MFDKVEYEYYITINGEEVKADNCSSNLLGYTRCEINENIYKNIDFRMVEINRIDGYYDNNINSLFSILLILIIPIIVFEIISKIFVSYR